MTRRAICMAVTTALVFLTLLAACGKNAIQEADAQRIQELGEEFLTEVNVYYYYKDDINRLERADVDVVVCTEDATYNAELVLNFYSDYRADRDASLTTVFSTKSFVVTKVVFEGGTGYYFRYEYDPFDEDSIVVSSQVLDGVDIELKNELKKIDLTLSKGKQTPILVTYKNVVDTELFGV